MNITPNELISRSRTYMGDDHDEAEGGFLSPLSWLALFNVEYQRAFRQWVRAGLVSPAPTDLRFVGPQAKTFATGNMGTFLWNGTFKAVAAGTAGNGVLVTLESTGTGTGQLIESTTDPLYPAGTVTFRYQIGVTTYGHLNTALAGSTLIKLVTPSTDTVRLFAAGPSVYGTTYGGLDYLAGVLALVGVVEDLGGSYRLIPPTQSSLGRSRFNYPQNAKAIGWEATGTGDNLTVIVHPESTTSTHIVRYIALPARATVATTTYECPDGADERVVLGMARRAGVKEGGASALVERLIKEADADLNFTAFGRNNGDSPRVRVNDRGAFLKMSRTLQFGALSSYRFV